jgi:hypothetical protein
VRTITVMPPGARACVVRVELENTGPSRELELRVSVRGGVTRQDAAWLRAEQPVSWSHDIRVEPSTNVVVFADTTAAAWSVQGAHPRPDRATGESLEWRRRVDAGARVTFDLVQAIGGSEREALDAFASIDPATAIDAARADWDDELRAIFTPGSDRYDGSLPVLETDDDDVRRAWLSGMLAVVYFRREGGAFGRTYDTLMPRYWQTVTFLWDYSLSSIVHGLLDPNTMRRHLEHWMETDIHSCFGTEWLTGGPVGGWYSVNDYAMTKMIADYLRWSGDDAWLDRTIAGETVGARLRRYATNWERFRTPSGLADYGGIGNLLECVSTYIHEIAALNAGNVWSMRFAADVAGMRGEQDDARALRDKAATLCATIQELYGEGWWHTRFPDGRLVPVRHCYDFITLLTTIDGDLTEKQRDEMVAFFARELQTPLWMHALSPADPDASFSVRPDHQWTGAYPAWPPLGVLGLFRAGHNDTAVEWLRGLGRSGNQGPYGQAHFAEPAVAPDAGGAIKAPSDFPYITDWAVSSGGAWTQAIIEGLFGVEARLDGIAATPRFAAGFDGALRGLVYRGTTYDVDATGLHEVRA